MCNCCTCTQFNSLVLSIKYVETVRSETILFACWCWPDSTIRICVENNRLGFALGSLIIVIIVYGEKGFAISFVYIIFRGDFCPLL